MTHKLPPRFEKMMHEKATKFASEIWSSAMNRTVIVKHEHCKDFKEGFLAGFSARDEQVERLVKALNYYKNLGDNSNCDIELALEKAMELRPHDPITINLGGKILAEVAGKALAEHFVEMTGEG